MMRMMLYEAAQSMLVRSTKWSWLKAWAMKIARHRGMKKAIVALARRLAVIMHRMWVDGTVFRWSREVATLELVDSLKALDPRRPIREADITRCSKLGTGLSSIFAVFG